MPGKTTLAEFRAELVTDLKRGSETAIGVTRMNKWIHRTMYEFGYAFKFRELEGYETATLLTGTDTVDQPTDFRTMHEYGLQLIGVDGFEGKILPESRESYIRRFRAADAGRPIRYHTFGPLFLVRPIADIDYTLGIHYWTKIEDLTDIDVSPFNEDWDDIIATGALARGFRSFQEFDRYQNVRNDYLGMIRTRKLAEDLEEFPEGGISAVAPYETDEVLYRGVDANDGDPE